jgi:hypothetical protein
VLSKRERQDIFNENIKIREKKLIDDCKQMLSETQYINENSTLDEKGIQQLISVLREADIRFKRMDHLPNDRLRLLQQQIRIARHKLRGPPPQHH